MLRRLGAAEADGVSERLLQQLEAGSSSGGGDDDAAEQMSEAECVAAAALLARRGDQRGARHGCVIVLGQQGGVQPGSPPREPAAAPHPPPAAARLLASGYNHKIPVRRPGVPTRRRVCHAEAHAVARAIQRYGEQRAFALFGGATAWIVELAGEVGYDDAPPCPNCEGMLRAVGVARVCHTTASGRLRTRELGPPLRHLLRDDVCGPFRMVLESYCVECQSAGTGGPRTRSGSSPPD